MIKIVESETVDGTKPKRVRKPKAEPADYSDIVALIEQIKGEKVGLREAVALLNLGLKAAGHPEQTRETIFGGNRTVQEIQDAMLFLKGYLAATAALTKAHQEEDLR